MPYRRPTKERAEAQKAARKLYVEDGLSLKEIRQQTGEDHENTQSVVQPRRLGRPAGDRNKDRTRPVREDLRGSLLDRAEAQIKADKLPHTEIGLIYKLERLIIQREKKEEMVTTIGNTLQYLTLYLMEHDPELARALSQSFKGICQMGRCTRSLQKRASVWCESSPVSKQDFAP